MALRVGVFSLIACGVPGRMRGGAGARTLGPRRLSQRGPLRRQTDLEAHARPSLATRSNAGPSRPGALLGASNTLALDTTPPGAYRHGRRRSHTGLAG